MPVGCIGTGTPDRYLDCIPCNDTAANKMKPVPVVPASYTVIGDPTRRKEVGAQDKDKWPTVFRIRKHYNVDPDPGLIWTWIFLTFPYAILALSLTQVPAVLWSRSRPEPDFFAGAGAGEKEPAPACCYVI